MYLPQALTAEAGKHYQQWEPSCWHMSLLCVGASGVSQIASMPSTLMADAHTHTCCKDLTYLEPQFCCRQGISTALHTCCSSTLYLQQHAEQLHGLAGQPQLAESAHSLDPNTHSSHGILHDVPGHPLMHA